MASSKTKVEVGDRVKIGQILVELDKDNLAARLREARASWPVPRRTWPAQASTKEQGQ